MNEGSHISPATIEKLIQLSKRIAYLKNNFLVSTATLTPVNYLEEMERFFKSDSYNPVFKYNNAKLKSHTGQLDEIKQSIGKLTLPDDLGIFLEEMVLGLLHMEKTRNSVGTPEFSTLSHELFDWGSDRLDLLLANTPKVHFSLHTEHELQNAAQIKERFEEVLKSYNITDFPVIIDNFSTHIISITSRGIKIGSKVKRFRCNVDRLIVHEIESHALQIINIKNSPNSLPLLTKYANMNLYTEGLAVYNEVVTRKITPEAFDLYFNRIRAVHMLHKSFREIFEALTKYVPPRKAYVITYRVKRGTTHTKEPGGFPKDASYLLGYHEVENLVSEGFPQHLLYATKSPVLTSLLNKYNLLDTTSLITPNFL